MLYILSNLDSHTSNFVANTAWVHSQSPSRAERVEITSAYATVGNLDINVVLGPGLWLEFLPDHLALVRIFVESHPSRELVRGTHFGFLIIFCGFQ